MAVFGMSGLLTSAMAVVISALIMAVLIIRVAMVTTRQHARSGACTTCCHPCQGRPVVQPGPVLIADEIRWPDRPAMEAWEPAMTGQDELPRLAAGGRQ
jgi:hypothetical protein